MGTFELAQPVVWIDMEQYHSVNVVTGRKYHSNTQIYYQQIRTIPDRLCQEHGLSIIMQGETSKAGSSLAAAMLVCNHIGETTFDMLVLVGTVKINDHVTRQLRMDLIPDWKND